MPLTTQVQTEADQATELETALRRALAIGPLEAQSLIGAWGRYTRTTSDRAGARLLESVLLDIINGK